MNAPISSARGQPKSELTEEERRRRLTGLTLHTLTISAILVIVVTGIAPGRPLATVWPVLTINLATLLCAQMAFYLNRTRLAAWIVVGPICPLLFVSMWFFGGVVPGGGIFFILGVMVAASTLGRHAAQVVALLGFLATSVVAWFDAHGGLPPSSIASTPLVIWAQVTVATLASAALLDALIRSLHQAQAEAETASQERAAVESRYVSAQKLEPVGKLASGVAHDFNNLLSVMTSVSAALRNDHADEKAEIAEESIHELLDDLDEATARASLMTGQLLSFSRRRTFEVDSIDLDEMLDSITPMLSRLLGDDIGVAFHGSTDGLTVEADRGQMEQVVLNLAVNARDAMPNGGTVEITLGRDTDSDMGVFLEVRDTGVGMSPEIVENIFTPFYTTKPTGTGLGLATVHDIVTRLCGEIEIDSTPGNGTTVRLQLPAIERPSNLGRPSVSRQRLVARSARVLLTEDHELLRRATQRSLEQVGYAVTSVFNGHEALVLLQGGATFDVLVTDISMPKMGGVELALSLEEQGLNLPIIFMSGNTGRLPKEVEHLAIKPRFLAKPFDQGDFLSAIDKSIEHGRAHDIRADDEKDGAA